MKLRQWIIAIVLLVLIAGAVVGILSTRPPSSHSPASRSTKTVSTVSTAVVDQTPLQTARRMSALAAADEERSLGHEAEKIADHEVDLAFADALRMAAKNPPKPTPALKALMDRKAKAEATVKADQDNIDQLGKKLAKAGEAQKDNINDQIAVAKGQFELDQDEFEDASEDLERAGGDPQAKIKQLLEQHEAGHNEAQAPNTKAIATEQEYADHTLLAVFRAWAALRATTAQIEQARQEALDKAQQLSAQHEAFENEIAHEKDDRENTKQQAAGFAGGGKATASHEESKAAAQAALASLRHHSENQKQLADLDKRAQDEAQLAEIYGNWLGAVGVRERAALHNVIESILWILLVVLIVYLAGMIVDRAFTGVSAENKRVDTLRTVVKFTAQALGVIAIAFLVFGLPTQTTTILGLAGAGLTVAMKDFIVAFFGWFVLMGKNGIRVGDWVEINGVGGEVVEVGLFNTVLLETGSWTDSGHPTGRRVSFVNSFAIEGHFFNFSTSGQWMWDELQVLIPPSQDPYPIIDGIQKLVERETQANAKAAEDEWHSATTRYRVQAFSATPGSTCYRRPAVSRSECATLHARTSGMRRASGCMKPLWD
ncbi:MAG TPA: mechanosensitive ion channel domain-containing protein [Candidatus Sulfotelmatobacter sp.]|nr:mechanosensitive ion channel domain-containing protein [Candidatus Sulfotelmatobacter sp.]